MMKRSRHRRRDPRLITQILLLLIATFISTTAFAAESDLWSNVTGPGFIPIGSPFTVTVGYGNSGPATAVSAYVNADFIAPMGLDVFLDNYFDGDGSMFTALQDSAAGTDTNGNAPMLFWDDFHCEHTFFQLQGDDTPEATPIQPLAPAASGSFTYEVTLPMEAPRTGTVEITEPANLVHDWTLTDPASLWVQLGLATPYNKYASTTCSKLVGTEEEDICQYISDNCWGARISQLDAPVEAQLELVNDGSPDPTLGCDALVDFTPGNIALLHRGTCEFGVKGFNAEQAGAVAVFMVNDGRCSDFPDGDDCVTNLGPGALGGLVTIPMALVSVNDGEPIVSAVEGGTTVTGSFGTSSTWTAFTTAFLADAADTDPDPASATTSWTEAVNEFYCTYAIDPEVLAFGEGGGQGVVAVTTEEDCPWTASTTAPWISLTSGSGTVGSGTLVYDVAANTGPGRSAIIEIANRIHSVTQASGNGCTTEVAPLEAAYPAAGGNGTIAITTPPGCPWAASSTVPWLVLTSPSTGVGSASLSYTISPNAGIMRFGAVLVDDQIHDVSQMGIDDCASGYGADDGTPENGYGWGTGAAFVQRFTPPSVPFVLDEVCTAFTQAGADSTLSYQVVIYDDDGPGGGPGTLLDFEPSIVGAVPPWLDTIFGTVLLDSNSIVVNEGSIYVGVSWDEISEIGFYVAADESSQTPAQAGYYSADGVTWDSLSTPFPHYRSLIMRIGGSATVDGDWQQVVGHSYGGGNGFGDSSNIAATALASFAGSLFLGTENASGGEVHSTADGESWQLTNNPGFGTSTNSGIATLITFNGDLYASTVNPAFGAQVWRMSTPPSWNQVATNGFGDPLNTSAPSGSVFDGLIYLGTSNINGCEILRTGTTGTSWSQVHTNGFGHPQNQSAESMAVFNDNLYVGTSNAAGAQLWRSPDGIVWFPIMTGGFGSTDNTSITDLVIMGSAIFAGLSNSATGAEIWRSADGAGWERIAGGGFGDSANSVLDALSVGDHGLAAGVSGPSNPGTIWISPDGLAWSQSSSPGFTNQDNRSTEALTFWNTRLFAGTSNPTAGCEVWRGSSQTLFDDGFESGDTTGWAMTIP